MCPTKRYIHGEQDHEYDLIWKRVFINTIKLKILRLDHPAGLYEWALNPMSSLIKEKTQIEKKKNGGEGHMKMALE